MDERCWRRQSVGMQQTITKQLRPGESHLPWLFSVKDNVAKTEGLTMGLAFCVREQDGWGKVEVELFSENEATLLIAFMTFQGGQS